MNRKLIFIQPKVYRDFRKARTMVKDALKDVPKMITLEDALIQISKFKTITEKNCRG
jgi:hypothetical protein